MFILVMLLTLGGTPQFQAYPKPLSQAECGQAKATNELQFAERLKQHPDAKVELKCLPWAEEKAE